MSELKKTGNTLKVAIPNYLTRVKLTEGRRKKYWEESKKDSLPKKFQTPYHIWKKGRLYDTITKDFVAKNAKFVDEPRYQQISGNEIYARMHESKRIKIVTQLKDHFKEHIAKAMGDLPGAMTKYPFFKNPVAVRMEVFTQFGVANWDVDNMWIYHKCFLDSLTDLGVIPEDNVLHVRQAGQTTFRPILEHTMPLMVFYIDELEFHYADETLNIAEDKTLELGEIEVVKAMSGISTIMLGTGKKKVIFGAAKKAIRKSMYLCLNNNKTAVVTEALHKKYENFFECFAEHRVQLIKTKE